MSVNKKQKNEYIVNLYGTSLSAESLGPVDLVQDGIVSKSLVLENFYQAGKVLGHQYDSIQNSIKDIFFEYKDNIYLKNKPVIRFGRIITNVYIDGDGNIRRYNCVQAQFFYYYWYEKLVCKQQMFKHLKRMVDSGHNLIINNQILSTIGDKDEMYKLYCTPTKPQYYDGIISFDCSVALCCILKGMRPWMRYYQENKEIYDPLGFELNLK